MEKRTNKSIKAFCPLPSAFLDNGYNSPKLGQFMNQCLQHRTYYSISFGYVGYSYEVGQTPAGDCIGVRTQSELNTILKKASKNIMSKKPDSQLQNLFATHKSTNWQERLTQVAVRFNREYQGQPVELPAEVQAMPIFREWASGNFSGRIASPFWEVAKPQKNQHCLDIGCGVSLLIYPWRDWQAFFYGQEISNVARDILNSRGPQLNSKLFKGVELGAAHDLNYSPGQFDLAIATGFSCYFPLEYWKAVLTEVKRVLKPGGHFVFDILNPEQPLAEDWAVLETYLGAEVFLEPLAEWEKTIKAAGAKVITQKSGELFELYKVRF